MKHPLPIHPLTGLQAIGWRDARPGEDGEQPIWPIRGASDDGGETDDDAGETADDDEGQGGAADGEEALGDAGKRALAQLRADLKAERTRRKTAETDLAAARAAKQETKTGDQPDVEQLRTQALAQARAETLRERALDRLEARAGRRFTDPADARAYLAGRVEEFIDGDKVDDTAINEALEELLTAKPYLAATATTGRPRFEGTGDGGARRGGNGPVQLTEADLKTMTSEQIDKAEREGRFDELLGKKR